MPKRSTHLALALAVTTATVLTATAVTTGAATPSGSASAPRSAAAGARPVVHTDKGAVRGVADGAVRVFAGIPYAAAPSGARRWSAPAPAARWRGVRDAAASGPACPQTGSVPPAGPFSDDEDCLSVDVTTPRDAARKARPVMVYLHGGDHTDGAGSRHGARRLAARGDVVVVTVNHRLGALGYLAHPELEQGGAESGNYGFLDQQAALRWVRSNAAAFGGDPGNVTLFGESAGSYSTCAHLVAPSSAGLFHRVINQSGPCLGTQGRTTREQALRQGTRTVAALKADPEVENWRTAPVDRLTHPFGTGPSYSPVYGGRLLPRTPQQALEKGEFAKVPVLQGVNRDEQRAMVYGMERAKQAETGDPRARLTEADLRHHLESRFGARDTARIMARYPVTAYDDTPALALAAALTDATYARDLVDANRALSPQVPTYNYEFAERTTPWYADPAFERPSFPAGAGHTFELPYLFELAEFEPLDPAQRALSDAMIDIWTGFARTGRAPWRPGTPAEPHTRALASGPGGIRPVDFAREHRYDFWTSLRP
ncbi:carboxylesterase/lipase family protein [Streptomyces sp. Da 82-17]|uniref:carboxylesterase/lipase family protein n=1 Tax=Streptomyces sp. Da 82-17 TaxID=3377116 RepID=UPI0038D3C0C4